MKKVNNVLLALAIVMSLAACGTTSTENGTASTENGTTGTTVITADSADKADIEAALNLANVKPEWTYSDNADAWTMATVTSVTNAELPDYQGVSVCVPGAYVKG